MIQKIINITGFIGFACAIAAMGLYVRLAILMGKEFKISIFDSRIGNLGFAILFKVKKDLPEKIIKARTMVYIPIFGFGILWIIGIVMV